jgi:hypothetical protein
VTAAYSRLACISGVQDMKKAARSAERVPISREQQILSVRRRLAFLRKLERGLKMEHSALLDAYNSVRRRPSRLSEPI